MSLLEHSVIWRHVGQLNCPSRCWRTQASRQVLQKVWRHFSIFGSLIWVKCSWQTGHTNSFLTSSKKLLLCAITSKGGRWPSENSSHTQNKVSLNYSGSQPSAFTIRPISLVLDLRSFSINSKHESCAVLNSTWTISPWLHVTCLFCFYIFPKYHTMAKIKGTEESIPHLLLPLIVSYTGLILNPCNNIRMWIKTNVFFWRVHLYITD